MNLKFNINNSMRADALIPHGKIVGPELLMASIGRAVFIDSLLAEMKEDGPGNSFVFIRSQENGPFFSGNDVFKKEFKKTVN